MVPEPNVAPDAPTVTARVDRGEARVGDVITLTITSIAPTAVAVNLPTQLSLGSFTLLDRATTEKDLGDGRMRREFILKVTAFEPGSTTVPGLDLTYLAAGGAVKSARSPGVPVTIKSLIANEPEPALKGDAGPVRAFEEKRWPMYLAGGLLAAGVGAVLGVWLLRRMRARAHKRPAPPPRPAHEIAFEKLDRLGARGFAPGSDFRPFYFELSEIIREYFGLRFGFDSLELTTDELSAELHRRAPRDLILGEVDGWLAACDLVKFAKISPTEAEARGAFESAIRMVTTTRPRPAPVTTAGSDPAGAPVAGADAGGAP